MENKMWPLLEASNRLANAGVNIRALSVAGAADFGVVHMIVNDPDLALDVLRDMGLTMSDTEIIAVEVPDRPGGLAEILTAFARAELSVKYIYAMLEKHNDNAVLLFRVDDTQMASDFLSEQGLQLLDQDDVADS
jgi:hypothetical protein